MGANATSVYCKRNFTDFHWISKIELIKVRKMALNELLNTYNPLYCLFRLRIFYKIQLRAAHLALRLSFIL